MGVNCCDDGMPPNIDMWHHSIMWYPLQHLSGDCTHRKALNSINCSWIPKQGCGNPGYPQAGGFLNRIIPLSNAYSSFKKPCLGVVFTFFLNVAVIWFGTTETGCFSTFSCIWLCTTMCLKVISCVITRHSFNHHGVLVHQWGLEIAGTSAQRPGLHFWWYLLSLRHFIKESFLVANQHEYLW